MSKETLQDYIRAECMLNDREFTLSSGRKSSLYFDFKKLLLDGEFGSMAADELLAVIVNQFPNIRVIGGEGIGGELAIAHLLQAARRKDYPISTAFLVHKRRGDGVQVISNPPPPGTDVIVVDDVATTGRALSLARDFVPQCNVVGGAVILDRSQGEAERVLGFPIISVFSEGNFIV